MTTNTAGSETVSAVLRALRERLEIAEDFPDDVLDEAAASAEAGLADMALADRREYPFVTIDPPDSMDLDQAVHIEREGEGYLVRYAISAVGLFIRPGGALERETHRRTQTVYGPDGSIPLHPHALSHGAASLLPNEDRPAYLWYLHLNPDGELRHKWVELALVRSVAKLSYEQVQDAVDGRTALDSGVPGDFPELLRRVGSLRVEREIARGGVSLALPEQVVEKGDGGYRLAFRALTDVEKWNAQISLVTGMAAADIMSRAAVGVLRTMPPAMPRDVDRLRSVARALRLDWPDDVDYREFVRSVGGDTPRRGRVPHRGCQSVPRRRLPYPPSVRMVAGARAPPRRPCSRACRLGVALRPRHGAASQARRSVRAGDLPLRLRGRGHPAVGLRGAVPASHAHDGRSARGLPVRERSPGRRRGPRPGRTGGGGVRGRRRRRVPPAPARRPEKAARREGRGGRSPGRLVGADRGSASRIRHRHARRAGRPGSRRGRRPGARPGDHGRPPASRPLHVDGRVRARSRRPARLSGRSGRAQPLSGSRTANARRGPYCETIGG